MTERAGDRIRPWRSSIRWAAGCALVAVGLAGRFDWSQDAGSYALRAYLSSLFLLAPTLVAVWGASRWLCPRRPRVALALVIATAILLALPYRWLGLERWHHYRERPVAHLPTWLVQALPALSDDRNAWGEPAWAETTRLPPADSRPSVFLHPPRLRECLAPAILGCAALLAASWNWLRRRAGRGVLGAGLLAMLAAQACLHVSNNSPYSYATHHYVPLESNYWHIAYLLGPKLGVVNADVVVFQDLEQFFWGTPRPTNTMLIRRPFFSYLAAQLTYFFNVFHVYLVLNLAAWAAAIACVYRFAKDEMGEEVARNAAFLAGCGQGFIMYVGQPTSYLAAYAGIAIVVWATGRVLGADGRASVSDWIALTAVLALSLLVYDMFGWFLFLAGYALLRRVPLPPVLGTLAAAAALYVGFLALQTRILGLELDDRNTRPLSEAGAAIADLLVRVRPVEIYRLTVEFFRTYASGLAGAFFVLPVVLAVAGLALQRHPRNTGLLLLLLAPSFVSVAFLSYGQAAWSGERLASMPRFSYAAFPAVYLLAGSAIANLELALRSRGRPGVGRLLRWTLLGSALLLANVDVLFGWPQLYYWFYWGGGGYF